MGGKIVAAGNFGFGNPFAFLVCMSILTIPITSYNSIVNTNFFAKLIILKLLIA